MVPCIVVCSKPLCVTYKLKAEGGMITRLFFQIKKSKAMHTGEIEKSKSHITVEIVEYVANSVVIKTILKKSTGNISVMSFDSGEGLTEKSTPFDTYAQIIEGNAEIVIANHSYMLKTGEAIVIPAHSRNYVRPNGRFKMILTIIKSGYED